MITVGQLIELRKTPTGRVKPKGKANKQHREWTVPLRADCPWPMELRVRQHVVLLESFSFVLLCRPPRERPFWLVRVNGDHGDTRRHLDGTVIEREPHIHRPTQSAWSMSVLDCVDGIDGETAALPKGLLDPGEAWRVMKEVCNIDSVEEVDRVLRRLSLDHRDAGQLSLALDLETP